MNPLSSLTKSEAVALTQGRLLYERGDIDSALEAFSIFEGSSHDFADVHYMSGILLERKGDTAAAIASMRRALKVNPEYSEALVALASLYEQMGHYDRSRGFAEKARDLSLEPRGPIEPITIGKIANLQAGVGDAYAEIGEYREAIEAYRKALVRCPDFHDIRLRLGKILRDVGLPHQAVLEFNHILEANSGFAAARIHLGLTYYAMAQAQDAAREWGEVLRQHPGREDVQLYLRMVDQSEPRKKTEHPNKRTETATAVPEMHSSESSRGN